MARTLSVAALIAIWAIAAVLAHSRLLPSPLDVAETIVADLKSGELPLEIGYTLARVVASFTIALVLGSVAGYAMGHFRAIDRYADPWLVALNKLPNVIVVMREGARALDPGLDEMARAYRLAPFTRLRHIVAPQLAPYLAAGSRSGLATAWKIVLVVELIGRPNGVGFVLGSAFSLFDMTKILSYAVTFIVLMLAIENFLVQPFERRAQRWRPRRP